MDKFEYKIKAEEIKELIARKEYAMAAELADEIDWRRVKSVMMLCTISDLYKINRRYEDAKNLLLLAYERRPGGRTICYSLCELYIKLGDFVRAMKSYNEFRQVAPNDSGCYLLHYKLLEAQNSSLEERIEVLEAYKSREHREKWSYELAYLYHRMGLATRCVEECDELILWFGEGKYVIKAMELKMLHQPLTPDQQRKYDRRFEKYESAKQSEEQPAEVQSAGGAAAREQSVLREQSAVKEQPVSMTQAVVQTQAAEKVQPAVESQVAAEKLPAGVKAVVEPAPVPEPEPEEMDIQVKTVDVGQCNTINLQAELAAGLQEFWRKEQITQSIVEPMMESDTESLDYPQVEEVDENDLETEVEEIEETEVFFGETGEITQVQPESLAKGDTGDLTELRVGGTLRTEAGSGEAAVEGVDSTGGTSAQAEQTVQAAQTAQTVQAQTPQTPQTEGAPSETLTEPEQDDTSRKVMEQMRLESLGLREEMIVEQPPKELEHVLSQESDGQLRIVVPERELIEKQITGQLNLQDFYDELERRINEQKEKRMQEVRKLLEQKTGAMLSGFEAKLRDDILKQLEEGADIDPQDIDRLVKDAMAKATEADTLVWAGAHSESEEPETGIEPEDQVEELEEIEETAAAESLEESADAESLEEVGGLAEESDDQLDELEEIAEEAEPEESNELTESSEAEENTGAETSGAEENTETEESFGAEITEAEASETEESTEAEENSKAEENAEAEECAETEDSGADEKTETEESPKAEEAAVTEAPESEDSTKTEESPKAEESAEAAVSGAQEKAKTSTEKPRARSLTREERELYAPFIQSRSAKEMLVKAIDGISMAAYTGNLIITGEEGMDTLVLAKRMIREVQMTDSNFSGKVAKISGSNLNQKDVAEIIRELNNGALIIKKASGMTPDTSERLYWALQQENLGIVVVLEDTKKSITKLLLNKTKLVECFTARVDLEAMSNDTLVAFGKQYARELEYFVDEVGGLALHSRIEELQTSDRVVTVMDVKEIVDEAIHRANRKTMRHFVDVLVGKRYNEEDMIILTERHFD